VGCGYVMVVAYIIVKVDPGREGEVTEKIVEVHGVTEGALTWGYSDILLKVNVDSIEKLRNVIFNTIRKIPGINDTQTIIVSEYFL
jgi:DNA-binding Lrp family transcriptional regulator